MNSVSSEFTQRSILLAACSSLCNRDLAGAGVFVRSARSSMLSASVIASAQYHLPLPFFNVQPFYFVRLFFTLDAIKRTCQAW